MADDEQQQMDGEARRTIARLAADTLPRLIERLTNSDLGELEVREDGWRIRLRRPMAWISLPARVVTARIARPLLAPLRDRNTPTAVPRRAATIPSA